MDIRPDQSNLTITRTFDKTLLNDTADQGSSKNYHYIGVYDENFRPGIAYQVYIQTMVTKLFLSPIDKSPRNTTLFSKKTFSRKIRTIPQPIIDIEISPMKILGGNYWQTSVPIKIIRPSTIHFGPFYDKIQYSLWEVGRTNRTFLYKNEVFIYTNSTKLTDPVEYDLIDRYMARDLSIHKEYVFEAYTTSGDYGTKSSIISKVFRPRVTLYSYDRIILDYNEEKQIYVNADETLEELNHMDPIKIYNASSTTISKGPSGLEMIDSNRRFQDVHSSTLAYTVLLRFHPDESSQFTHYYLTVENHNHTFARIVKKNLLKITNEEFIYLEIGDEQIQPGTVYSVTIQTMRNRKIGNNTQTVFSVVNAEQAISIITQPRPPEIKIEKPGTVDIASGPVNIKGIQKSIRLELWKYTGFESMNRTIIPTKVTTEEFNLTGVTWAHENDILDMSFQTNFLNLTADTIYMIEARTELKGYLDHKGFFRHNSLVVNCWFYKSENVSQYEINNHNCGAKGIDSVGLDLQETESDEEILRKQYILFSKSPPNGVSDHAESSESVATVFTSYILFFILFYVL
jgi:hypothetical protein